MSNITTYKSRRKVVATAMIGGLLSLTLVGGTYAGLASVISTESGNDSVSRNLTYSYAWHVTSEPMPVVITPVTDPTAQVFTKTVTNNSSVDSHFALWASDLDLANIPDSLLDETRVQITYSAGDNNNGTVGLSLRKFLGSAYVFKDLEEQPVVLPAGTDLDLVFSFTQPDNTSDVDFSDAIGSATDEFITNISFNQVINGTSDLWEFMKVNSLWGDDMIHGHDLLGQPFTY